MANFLHSLLYFQTMNSVSTVVYLNIRVQHEGLNREVLLRDLGRGTLEGVEYGMVNVEDGDYSAALNENKV